MPAANELSWLRDAVGGKSSRSLLFVSANPLDCTQPAFWTTMSHPDLFRSIAESLAKEGRRVILVTDADSDPARRHYLALQFARALIRQDRSILLVDADLDGDGFSAGLDEPDREGWADLVLYGASPEATIYDSPAEGIRILGAGSLRPSPGLALDVAALERGIERLRNHFETVLVVSGARRASDAWNELLGACDAVVLATSPDAPRVRGLIEHIQEHHVPLWGAAVFGSDTQAVELTVDSQFKEKTRAVQPLEMTVDGKPIGAASSAPFRWGAGVIALLLMSFVGWWWFAGRQTTTPQAPPQLALVEPAEAIIDTVEVLGGSEESTTVDRADVEVADVGAREASPVVQQEEPEPAPVELAEATTPKTTPPPTPVTTTPEVPASFSDPLLLSPGGGWSLHPWSFPDSAEAVSALMPLERDGMKPRVRGFDLKGKGRWFRVLVGRYDSREAALGARPRLAERRGIDWVGIVRVP